MLNTRTASEPDSRTGMLTFAYDLPDATARKYSVCAQRTARQPTQNIAFAVGNYNRNFRNHCRLYSSGLHGA